MDFRKIISFGNSSYVVSLPKEWVERNQLKKGDVVYINDEPDMITILPRQKENNKEVKEISISIDNKTEELIKREIISAYIQNFNLLTIYGSSLKDKNEFVRGILHNLMALEIIEQTSEKLVAKDFVNMEEININTLIKKIDLIVRSMLTDITEALKLTKQERQKIIKSIINRDMDVNRLTFLIYRSIKYFMNNPAILKSNNLTNFEMLNAWLVVSHIERIGDETKRICRFLQSIEESAMENLSEIISRNHKIYSSIMKCYYNKDIKAVYELASEKNITIKQIEDFFRKHNNKNSDDFIKLCERLKGMTIGIHSITRVVHN